MILEMFWCVVIKFGIQKELDEYDVLNQANIMRYVGRYVIKPGDDLSSLFFHFAWGDSIKEVEIRRDLL
jgi:hypothetical protein